MIATGWDARWPDRSKYMNERSGVKHFPGVSIDAAAYLAKERRVVGIGIDTASIDYGPSKDFMTHRILNGAGIYGLENVTNMEKLPPTGISCMVMPRCG